MAVRTLRGRVSLLALVVIAAWVVVLAATFDLIAGARIRSQLDDKLRVRAQAASALITRAGGRITGLRESATDRELDAGTWLYADGRLVEHPPVSPRLQREVDHVARGTGFHSVNGHRLYVLPVRAGGLRLGAVVTAVSTESAEDAEHTVIVGSAVVALLVLAGAYPVLRVATGRALQPVARMADQAAEWSSSGAPERFGESQDHAELRQLGRRLDELLDRLDAVLRHERQLSGELSHELRTPLTRLLGEIDLVREQCSPEILDALAAMRASCLQMDAILDAVLAATRAELVGGIGRTDVDDVLHDYAAAGALREGAPVEVQVRTRPSGLRVGVERAIVVRILNAVVDNARRHAAGRVWLTATAADGRVAITVEDDGPGVPAEDRERIFQPGYTRTDGPHGGAGLGLPLGRRLARAADGDLVLDDTAARTRFVLTLPRG